MFASPLDALPPDSLPVLANLKLQWNGVFPRAVVKEQAS